MTPQPPPAPSGSAQAQVPPGADQRAAWLAEDQAVRARLASGAGPGVSRPEQLKGLTGLQLMQALMAGELPFASIAQTLDFVLLHVEPGQAIFQGTPSRAHLNPMGTVHGGWYATLLDSALGCAVHTMMPAGRAYTTAELSLNIVRAAWPDREPLRAIGQVLHAGRQLATAEGRLVDAQGRLYAHATTTCLVFETPDSARG
ncbi:MAG: PaaI family thioesterase [Rubrivivax sp.]|nr:PaaI family thioesterase [Rubrivivax sp.]